jgi:hypothetical protein
VKLSSELDAGNDTATMEQQAAASRLLQSKGDEKYTNKNLRIFDSK